MNGKVSGRSRRVCGHGFHVASLQYQLWVMVVAVPDQLYGLCLYLNCFFDLSLMLVK